MLSLEKDSLTSRVTVNVVNSSIYKTLIKRVETKSPHLLPLLVIQKVS